MHLKSCEGHSVDVFHFLDVQDYLIVDNNLFCAQPVAINEDFNQSRPREYQRVLQWAGDGAATINIGVAHARNIQSVNTAEEKGIQADYPSNE